MNLRPFGASRLKIVEIYLWCIFFLNTGQKNSGAFILLGMLHPTWAR